MKMSSLRRILAIVSLEIGFVAMLYALFCAANLNMDHATFYLMCGLSCQGLSERCWRQARRHKEQEVPHDHANGRP